MTTNERRTTGGDRSAATALGARWRQGWRGWLGSGVAGRLRSLPSLVAVAWLLAITGLALVATQAQWLRLAAVRQSYPWRTSSLAFVLGVVGLATVLMIGVRLLRPAWWRRALLALALLPFPFKVWAHPLELMDYGWIGERVSMVDLEKVLRSIILEEDNLSWGPNNTFKFPLRGGTGGLYSAFVPHIADRLHLDARATHIDPQRKRVTFADGTTTDYDVLISTLALDRAVALLPDVPAGVREAAGSLDYSGSYFVGIGVEGKNPSSKCWMYFPEDTSPFYRVTYLSNYSPYIAPAGHYSLLAETSYSPYKREDPATIVAEVERGMRATTLLRDNDVIASRWCYHVDHSYPVPTLRRDPALAVIQPWLAGRDIVSRGRFGAWMYEIGNMDHSVMQGVEAVNWLVEGEPETTWPGAQPKPLPAPVRLRDTVRR